MNSITNITTSLEIPLFSSKVACGFPSPADDHQELSLDLNQHLIPHPASTFFVRAEGDSMRGVGILPGDLLIVDRSLSPRDNSIIIAVLNGDFTVKRLKISHGKGFLYPANKNYQPIAISKLDNFQMWGVVTHAIHDVRAS
jgi:DNA polymerase V